jgi:hypothetical protein
VQTIVVAFSDRLNGVTDLTVIYVISNKSYSKLLSRYLVLRTHALHACATCCEIWAFLCDPRDLMKYLIGVENIYISHFRTARCSWVAN